MSKEYRYNLSFAELLDRATIIFLKIAASKGGNEAFATEFNDTLHDIQLHLDEKPMTAEMIRGLISLSMVNKFIFDNETYVRDADDNANVDDETLLAKLKESHKANSLRAASKKHIQLQRGGRVDEKLNYGKSSDFWNISF